MKDQREISRSFLRWLDRVDDRPFFAFLNYFDAHAPHLPPAGFDTLFGSEHTLDNPRVGASREWEEAEVEAQLDAYEGSIAGLDGELRLLLGELESRGSLDNTIVIITSDHGEHFGEHGFMGHAKTFYMPLLHVPLLIRWPSRVSAGARVATPVSLRDLAATILDLARIDHGGEIPGRSLSKHWTGSETGEPQDSAFARAEVRKGVRIPGWYPVARGDMHSLVSATHHYIKHADGREELYAYFDDPDEEWNLADKPEASEALQRFRNAMASIGRRRAQDRDAGH
jgi:arylsulfatase A-like enzyme